MGFFDKFKREPEREKNRSSEFVFQPSGLFEITSCPGKDALAYLQRLREEGLRSGFSAILLGGQDDADRLVENRKNSGTTPGDYLKIAENFDTEAWLKERLERDPESFGLEPGDWPSKAPEAGRILAHLDILSGKPKDIVWLAKVPTPRNWEVPAYIGMGGWNECPDAAVLTAFARRWHERHGAEIVSITHDVMEFFVPNPPQTRESAMELAKEQYLFCQDIVDQGVGDVTMLAATLLNGNYWYFWWD